MSFKSVRSTRPVQFIPIGFITNPAYACKRDEFHLVRPRCLFDLQTPLNVYSVLAP